MIREEPSGIVKWLPRIAVSLVVGTLYIAACATPAVEFVEMPRAHDFGEINIIPDQEVGTHLGITALIFGSKEPWILPWSANVFLFVAWILLLLKKNKLAVGFGAAAALVAFSVWVFSMDDRFYHLNRLMIGYYFWHASMIALALGAAAIWLIQKPKVAR
jgi:hypothetical protein